MTPLAPFVRTAGSGSASGVVCIHANASSSAQWRPLMDLLSPTHLVFAPDSYGSGKSPDWHSDRTISLSDEVEFLRPVLEQAGDSFALVGHSYGAAVALMVALAFPDRVRALALYEPTLFSVVDQQTPPPNDADGIRHAARAAGLALDAGDRNTAAEYFIDYWMGAGSWQATPPQRKPAISDSVTNVRRWAHALFTEPTPVRSFAALNLPILYMLGEASPESAHAVANVIIPHLQHVTVVRFPRLGHMAPITHPEAVNREIARFLSSV